MSRVSSPTHTMSRGGTGSPQSSVLTKRSSLASKGGSAVPTDESPKKRMCRIVLPPKPRPGFFDDLYQLGFIELIAKVYFLITVLVFALAVLEYAWYGHSVPASAPRGPCCSKQKGYSCFLNSKCSDGRPRAYNGCAGCQLSGATGPSSASWLTRLFLGD